MLRTPKADENVVIYETRKNRVSGSHTQVIDLRPQGGKYALVCVTHGTQFPRNVRLATEAESHKSHTWCPQCTDTRPVEDRAPVAPKVITLNASPDAVKVFTGMFGDTPAEVDEAPVADMPASDAILEVIGNATSSKTCLKRVEEAGL